MRPVSLLFHDVFISDPRESGFPSPGADRYKLSVVEFDTQLAGLSFIRGREEFSPDISENPSRPRLTFDDGGASFYTIVADKLEARGIVGCCFVTTGCIGRRGFLSAAQIRELDARGHLIGSHSVSHPMRFSRLSREEMQAEWSGSRKVLEDILGHAVTVASVPGGYFSREVGLVADECGMVMLFNSEPVTSEYLIESCTIAGRFTVRRGAPSDFSHRLVRRAPWTRSREWASWNAKGFVKPLLGSSYPRVAEWIHGGVQ